MKSSLTIFGGCWAEDVDVDVEVEVEASGCVVSAGVDVDVEDDDEDEVKLEMSHFAIEPSLLAVKRYLQSSLVVAQVTGRRWTRLLVVADDVGT